MLPMCGRYTFTFSAKSLAEAFDMVPYGFDIQKGYNIAPGHYIVIVRPEKGQRAAEVAFWGLIPGWVKDPNAFSKPINARADTLEAKPTFRTAFKRKRCIIPASGFYEWKNGGKTNPEPEWSGFGAWAPPSREDLRSEVGVALRTPSFGLK